eukprot:4735917-Pleurochrysis_carterae.AAC.1
MAKIAPAQTSSGGRSTTCSTLTRAVLAAGRAATRLTGVCCGSLAPEHRLTLKPGRPEGDGAGVVGRLGHEQAARATSRHRVVHAMRRRTRFVSYMQTS